MIIVVEGPIAVGKSTFCQAIKERGHFLGKPVYVFFERVRPKMLALYLEDREKYAYAFQINVLTERFIIHQQAEILTEMGYCVIIDRGIAGDISFAIAQKKDGFINEREWDTYIERVIEHKETKWRPDLTLYLTCPVGTAFNRLKTRGNQDEIKNYKIEYFENLETCQREAFGIYDEMFGQNKRLEFDWSENLNLSEEFIQRFEEKLKLGLVKLAFN